MPVTEDVQNASVAGGRNSTDDVGNTGQCEEHIGQQPQSEHFSSQKMSQPMPQRIQGMSDASAPRLQLSTSAKTVSWPQQQPTNIATLECAPALRDIAYLSPINLEDVVQRALSDGPVSLPRSTAFHQIAHQSNPSLESRALHESEHNRVPRTNPLRTATATGHAIGPMHTVIGTGESCAKRSDGVNNSGGLSMWASAQSQGAGTKASNTLPIHPFSGAGPLTMTSPTCECATDCPMMLQVMERYNTFSPHVQRDLLREFVNVTDLHSQAHVSQTTPSNPTGPVSETKIEISVHPGGQSRIHPFPHGLIPSHIRQNSREVFPNIPSTSIGSTTPSTISTVPAAGTPSAGTLRQLTGARTPESSVSRAHCGPVVFKYMPPSQYCHLCCRKPKKHSPHVVCGNFAAGACRKSICEKCFADEQWNGKVDLARARALGANWKCTHCSRVCPSRAQCFVYARATERRRMRRLAKREAKQRRENVQHPLVQANLQVANAPKEVGQSNVPQEHKSAEHFLPAIAPTSDAYPADNKHPDSPYAHETRPVPKSETEKPVKAQYTNSHKTVIENEDQKPTAEDGNTTESILSCTANNIQNASSTANTVHWTFANANSAENTSKAALPVGRYTLPATSGVIVANNTRAPSSEQHFAAGPHSKGNELLGKRRKPADMVGKAEADKTGKMVRRRR